MTTSISSTSQTNVPPSTETHAPLRSDVLIVDRDPISSPPTWRQRFIAFINRHRSPKKIGDAPGFRTSLVAILKTSWLNLLLVFIPLSWAFNFAKPDSHTIIFVFSFLAIIPLAKLLAFATDELSMRLGQTLAGLLNATLGNTVELIVAILALVKCQLSIVQSSLVGSILSNLLLVLGMCFFAGGTRFSEQGFGLSSTQLNSSLLTLSVIGVLLPAAFHMAVEPDPDDPSHDPLTNQQEGSDILRVSHGVAIVLLFIYGAYLFFQLFSHKNLYEDTHPNVQKSVRYAPRHEKAHTEPVTETSVSDPEAPAEEEEEEEKPQMSVPMTIGLLVVVTVLVAVTAEWLVDSINGLTESGSISKEFVGLILLPIVGNAAEHVTAVTVSVKDKLTLSLGVAVGSSIQIALFVIPFIVTLGWMMGKPLTLLFDPFESIVLFLAVLTVNYVTQDGKSNWLEGMILMCLYVIIAVTFWFYPGVDPAGVLSSCH
ncbi:calcium/proton exchanger [Dentipellis sp. KUC8613]|nr:calcium/proton exchanger [Dentipellis sp. KUC8613]